MLALHFYSIVRMYRCMQRRIRAYGRDEKRRQNDILTSLSRVKNGIVHRRARYLAMCRTKVSSLVVENGCFRYHEHLPSSRLDLFRFDVHRHAATSCIQRKFVSRDNACQIITIVSKLKVCFLIMHASCGTSTSNFTFYSVCHQTMLMPLLSFVWDQSPSLLYTNIYLFCCM